MNYSSFIIYSMWEVHLNNIKSKLFILYFVYLHLASDSSCGPVNAFCVGVEMAHSYTFGNTSVLLGCLHTVIFICAWSQALATLLTPK